VGERVVLVEGSSNNGEGSDTEDYAQDDLVLLGQAHFEQQWHGYAYYDQIAGDVEDGIGDEMVCCCGALFYNDKHHETEHL
jgi:hypothetical protein